MKKAKKRQKKGQKRVFGKKTALFPKKAFFGPFNRGLASFLGSKTGRNFEKHADLSVKNAQNHSINNGTFLATPQK